MARKRRAFCVFLFFVFFFTLWPVLVRGARGKVFLVRHTAKCLNKSEKKDKKSSFFSWYEEEAKKTEADTAKK